MKTHEELCAEHKDLNDQLEVELNKRIKSDYNHILEDNLRASIKKVEEIINGRKKMITQELIKEVLQDKYDKDEFTLNLIENAGG